MKTIDPLRSLETLHKCGPEFAKAKARRVMLEESLRATKSLMMLQSGQQSVAAQERDAYASAEYQRHLEDLRDAVEAEEVLRLRILTAQAAIECWRSQEASNRMMDRAAA